jgi:hypothetical protein
VTREPNFDELIDAETTGPERERLRNVHELLLQAGPPAELHPELEAGPNLQMTLGGRRPGVVKTRATLLLAAAIAVVFVFIGGYVVGQGRKGGKTTLPVASLTLHGTSAEPEAQASLEVWHPKDGNWPMTLTVFGLSKLPPRRYYEVYVVRHGAILGSCGMFRIKDASRSVSVTLNAPYPLHKGDSWVVTRQGPGEVEPGATVLRPVKA